MTSIVPSDSMKKSLEESTREYEKQLANSEEATDIIWMGPRRALSEVPECCQIPGCNEKHSARNLCDLHYYSWRRYGDPLAPRRKAKSELLQLHWRENDCP